MIAHLESHWLGLIHLLIASLAILFGTLVILSRKGTRRHRWVGRIYVIMMVFVNLTALLIYELFGHFGPFHWMALFSLATVFAGYLPALRKTPHWKHQHAYFMAGSYVGLMAAAIAEIAGRVPGWSFGPAVVISSIIVIVIGVRVMQVRIPWILKRSPQQ